MHESLTSMAQKKLGNVYLVRTFHDLNIAKQPSELMFFKENCLKGINRLVSTILDQFSSPSVSINILSGHFQTSYTLIS